MKLLDLESRLRISLTVPLIPHTSPWHVQGKIYLIYKKIAFVNLGG